MKKIVLFIGLIIIEEMIKIKLEVLWTVDLASFLLIIGLFP